MVNLVKTKPQEKNNAQVDRKVSVAPKVDLRKHTTKIDLTKHKKG